MTNLNLSDIEYVNCSHPEYDLAIYGHLGFIRVVDTNIIYVRRMCAPKEIGPAKRLTGHVETRAKRTTSQLSIIANKKHSRFLNRE